MGEVKINQVLKGQPLTNDFVTQDRFNIKLTAKKKKAITEARKKRQAETYTPLNSFNDFSGG